MKLYELPAVLLSQRPHEVLNVLVGPDPTNAYVVSFIQGRHPYYRVVTPDGRVTTSPTDDVSYTMRYVMKDSGCDGLSDMYCWFEVEGDCYDCNAEQPHCGV